MLFSSVRRGARARWVSFAGNSLWSVGKRAPVGARRWQTFPLATSPIIHARHRLFWAGRRASFICWQFP